MKENTQKKKQKKERTKLPDFEKKKHSYTVLLVGKFT